MRPVAQRTGTEFARSATGTTAHIEDEGDESAMRVMLDYGRSGLAVDVPDDRLAGPLTVREVSPLEDPAAAVAAALERPIGTPPLRKVTVGRGDACIVDCTRELIRWEHRLAAANARPPRKA